MPVVPFAPFRPIQRSMPDPVYIAMSSALTFKESDRIVGPADDSDVLSQSKSSAFEKAWRDMPMSKNIEDERDDVLLEHNQQMPLMKVPNGK